MIARKVVVATHTASAENAGTAFVAARGFQHRSRQLRSVILVQAYFSTEACPFLRLFRHNFAENGPHHAGHIFLTPSPRETAM